MEQRVVISRIVSAEDQKDILIDYLLVKVQQEDWHGVADAAMDIRELEAKFPGLKK